MQTLAEETFFRKYKSAAGGRVGQDRIHDLNRFIRKTVCNGIHGDDADYLTLHGTPDGEVIPGIGWRNGENILIHGRYKEKGWYFAFKDGFFGYVNPKNVD